jgi:hypothetical protein
MPALGSAGSSSSGAVALTTVATAGAAQSVTAPPHGSAAYKLTGSAASCTITPTGGTAGEECALTLYLDQDATGGRAWTFAAKVGWGTVGAPAFSTAASKRDVVVLTTIDGGATFLAGLVAVGLTAS